MLRLMIDTLATPLGDILLVGDETGLRALDFADFEPRMRRLLRLHHGEVALTPGRDPAGATRALAAYFAGALDALDALPVATGGTAFQRAVWAGLRTIPRGTTVSYAGLAARIGRPRAVRAVGLANGANPVGIVVPCHRVIGAGGAMTGYAGGVARKRWLLAHEGALPPATASEAQAALPFTA
jgi:O-6-methylguanine DNA methyltransferase